MFGLKSMFGASVDYAQLVKEGAIIVDVRSKGEYASGHIKGSKNIPLDVLQGQIENLKKENKTIITCCASGMRSGSAKSVLAQHGIECHNGGGWRALESKI
ncbi:MAG: rhodanese-like domain-containing protein [Crocinitomicaceae bacterium]|nr:rhodanese-like domain-containing protein [Crocinitomicaceae bacterium]